VSRKKVSKQKRHENKKHFNNAALGVDDADNKCTKNQLECRKLQIIRGSWLFYGDVEL
jgi:hypothetical protein